MTYEGKLMLLEQMMHRAEESFDNEERTYNYDMTEAEYQLFELVQTLGTDFFKDISNLLYMAHPSISLARNTNEARKMIDRK